MDNDKLESFYKEYFFKNDIEEFLTDISEIFVEKYFIHENISNHDYERDVFKLILNLIAQELEDEFEYKSFSESFAAYIFKKNIKLIFKFLSDEILKELAFSNDYIMQFLKYYSQDIVVVDGKRYKIPELKTQEGAKWNVISMIGIVKTFIKAREHIYDTESVISELENKISLMHIGGLSPIEYNAKVDEQFFVLEQNIKKNTEKINILNDALMILKSKDERAGINSELEEYKIQRLQLREKKKLLLKKKINQYVISNYEKLLHEIENTKRKTKAQYTILAQNKHSYNSIRDSLSKVLLSKKQLI